MAELDLPTWLAWLLAAGAATTALLGVVRFISRTGHGMRWAAAAMREGAREAVLGIVQNGRDELLADTTSRLERIEQQLTSSNGGSLREQVNGTREDLSHHIAISAKDRRELRDWLRHLDPDGPPG